MEIENRENRNWKEKMSKLFRIGSQLLLNIMFIFSIVMIGTFLYWCCIQENQVLAEQEGNFQIEKTVYKRGEPLLIHFKQCKNMDIQGESSGAFVDGVVFLTPPYNRNLEKGCYDWVETTVIIPITLPAGNYQYSETVRYRINPLREVVYRFSTPQFEVVE